MKTQSIDTNETVERVLISLVKKKSPAQKFSQTRSLSQTTMQLSKRAIRRANKDLSEAEVDFLFIKYHYGKDFAERVEKYKNGNLIRNLE